MTVQKTWNIMKHHETSAHDDYWLLILRLNGKICKMWPIFRESGCFLKLGYVFADPCPQRRCPKPSQRHRKSPTWREWSVPPRMTRCRCPHGWSLAGHHSLVDVQLSWGCQGWMFIAMFHNSWKAIHKPNTSRVVVSFRAVFALCNSSDEIKDFDPPLCSPLKGVSGGIGSVSTPTETLQK